MAYIPGTNAGETLTGSGASDILDGFGGNDTLIGGAGGDELFGGDGEDTASYSTAGAGVQVMLMGPLSNLGDAAGDTYRSMENIEGTNFSDGLYGDDSDNKIYGLGGGDTLFGAGGKNFLYGGDGEDDLVGGAGIDFIDGGNGPDEWSYQLAPAGVTVSMVDPSLNTGWAAGDTAINVERVIGSQFPDVLYGDANGNNVWGLDGNDLLFGGGGYDSIIGDAGADTIDGGGGGNLLDYETSPIGLTASLANASINTGHAAGDTYINVRDLAGSFFSDVLYGDDGPNNFLGLDGNDSIFAGGGDDIIEGQVGGDFMDGQDGFDWVAYASAVTAILTDPSQNTGIAAGDTYANIEGIIGSSFADVLGAAVTATTIQAGAGDDQAFGNAGQDWILGQGGDDSLTGGAEEDHLFGGDGKDRLVGGLGRDILDGGDGRDIFDFDTIADTGKPRPTRDRINDFDHRIDRIDLSTIDANEDRPGDKAFRFLRKEGADFTGHAGQLHWFQAEKKGKDITNVEGDTDGNGKADFKIELTGHLKLTVTDFFL